MENDNILKTKNEIIERKKEIEKEIKKIIKRSKTVEYQIWDLHLLAELRWELKYLCLKDLFWFK